MLGYKTRQVGSHIRIATEDKGVHHITVPEHNPLELGTLSNILKDITAHLEMTQKRVNRTIILVFCPLFVACTNSC